MKLLIIVMITILMGCTNVADGSDYYDDASDFYVAMFSIGGINEEITEMYEQFVKHDKEGDALYDNLINMYNALNEEDSSATKYQLAVMELLNES